MVQIPCIVLQSRKALLGDSVYNILFSVAEHYTGQNEERKRFIRYPFPFTQNFLWHRYGPLSVRFPLSSAKQSVIIIQQSIGPIFRKAK